MSRGLPKTEFWRSAFMNPPLILYEISLLPAINRIESIGYGLAGQDWIRIIKQLIDRCFFKKRET
jgi:hypothetical protein